VVSGFEVIRLVEQAKTSGMAVEFHGGGMVASMATVLIASGSPGHRYVYEHAFVVIHGIQVQAGPFGESECFSPTTVPVNERDRTGLQLTDTMIALLAGYAGQPVEVAASWLTCGNEQYGDGWLLVKLGLADLVE